MTVLEVVAIITGTTAVGTIAIATAQVIVARATLANALFDRRLAVYEGVRKASSCCMIGDDHFRDKDGLGYLHRAMNQSHFIFGKEVHAYLAELWKAGIVLHVAPNELEHDNPDRDPVKTANKVAEARRVLMDGTEEMRKLLEPYMAMTYKLRPRRVLRFWSK